jgi:limonene-1,2-epoxide hydrolase
MAENQNEQVVKQFWRDLYKRDFPSLAAYFGPDSQYTDVPSPADDVAHGPAEIIARLTLGFGPLESIGDTVSLSVAQGDAVVTEHVEHWKWPTGETLDLPFVSVQVLSDQKITRWWDYWDMQTLMNAAPAWWVEHVMQGYR